MLALLLHVFYKCTCDIMVFIHFVYGFIYVQYDVYILFTVVYMMAACVYMFAT